MEKKSRKKWIHKRHLYMRNLLYILLKPYCKIKYGLSAEPFKEQNGRQYLILYNHQTPFDQFFLGMSFKGTIYHLSTEDIFSKGITSSLIRYLVAPIPIKKQTTDAKAVINCLRVAKEGGTIAIAPEGNRTYSGKTEHMSKTVLPLMRKMNLPVVLYRIEGGYGAQPRWSDCVRKGKVRSYVARVIEPEEYKQLTDDELFLIIKDGLYVNDCRADGRYYSKNSAEYLERAIYVCPKCGLSEFYSKLDVTTCKKCGIKVKYLPTKELEGVDCAFPFTYFDQWYDHQCDFINNLDLTQYKDEAMYTENVTLLNVVPYKKKEVLHKSITAQLFGDRVVFNDGATAYVMLFDDISAMAVLGRNKANIYYDDKIYQIKADKHFNALKYVNIYYHYKNVTKGDSDGKFLGL